MKVAFLNLLESELRLVPSNSEVVFGISSLPRTAMLRFLVIITTDLPSFFEFSGVVSEFFAPAFRNSFTGILVEPFTSKIVQLAQSLKRVARWNFFLTLLG